MSKRPVRGLLIPAAMAVVLLPAFDARAQFAVPGQGASVAKEGTLLIVPSLGVITEDPFTEFAMMGRARYSFTDEFSATGRLGFIIGDLDVFSVGADAKYRFIKAGSSPVDVSAFGALDVSVGDLKPGLDIFAGPLVGLTIQAGQVDLSPYAGAGLGISYIDVGLADKTEFTLGFIGGVDVALTERLSAFTELSVGATDGIALINWHFGISIALFDAQTSNASGAETPRIVTPSPAPSPEG